MEYSIGMFSHMTGIGIHTLRYYEKENLIAPKRKDNGRRCYTDNDIRWAEFIRKLKDTGMPIKEIQRYAYLRAEGDSTLESRMEMLIEHRTKLLSEIATMQDNLLKLDDKIEFYATEIAKKQKITG